MGSFGKQILAAALVLLAMASALAGDELIEIPISLSKQKLIYNSDTGELALKTHPQGTEKKLGFIRLPKHLEDSSLAASADSDPNRKNIILLRHGDHASVLDLSAGTVLRGNLGPIKELPIPWMSYDPKSNSAVFPGRALGSAAVRDENHLMIFFGNGTFFEGHQPDETKNFNFKKVISQFEVLSMQNGPKTEFVFKTITEGKTGIFGVSKSGKNISGVMGGYDIFIGQMTSRKESAPLKQASLSKILKENGLSQIPHFQFGDDSLGEDIVLGPREASKAFAEKVKYALLGPKLSIFGAKEMANIRAEEQRVEREERARVEALQTEARAQKLQEIQEKLEMQIQMGTHLEQKLSEETIGQEEAIKKLVQIAQRQQKESGRYAVVLLGGTTGTGKTSSFELFIRHLFPKAQNPFLKISMGQMRTAEFFTTELFGSAPGYQGSASVTKLMVWLMENPEGGGFLLDEIEKTNVEVLQVLQSFLEDGRVTIRPDVMKALLMLYSQKPVAEWPKILREKTRDGQLEETSFDLKLTSKHIVGLTTNAGAESITGDGNSSLGGRRLVTDEEIRIANSQLDRSKITNALKARGYPDDLLKRITDVIPFKVLTREELGRIYQKELVRIQKEAYEEYMVSVRFSDSFLNQFMNKFYAPLEGARFVRTEVESWVKAPVFDKILQREIPVNSAVELSFDPGTDKQKARLLFQAGRKQLTSVEVGDPVKLGPKDLLAKAKANLWTTLTQRVFGHQSDLKLVHDNIIAQLVRAVDEPAMAGKPVVLYLDGTSGIGKTEIAKATNEALFGNAASIQRIDMNTVNNLNDFDQILVKPLTKAVRTNPQYLVGLLDELPRAGSEHSSYKTAIHNNLFAILDEGVLPPPKGETRIVNGRAMEVSEPTQMPAATILFASGNLTLDVLQEAEHMNLEELGQAVLEMKKNSTQFDQHYSQVFGSALRGRLGEPIILNPLNREDLYRVIEKIWTQEMHVLRQRGYQIPLTPELKDTLSNMLPASLGPRGIQRVIRSNISNPLIALSETHEGELNSSSVIISAKKNFQSESLEFQVQGTGGPLTLSAMRAPMAMRSSGAGADTSVRNSKHSIGFLAAPYLTAENIKPKIRSCLKAHH